MAYDLAVRCVHQTGVVSVHLHMSTKEIMKLIGLQFNIIEEPFDLQVYDDRFRTYIDFDDEYAEELRQISPRTHRKTLTAEVLFTNTRETENISCYTDDVSSPSYVPANSPSSVSVSEDLRFTTTNFELDLCLHDSSLSSPDNVQLDINDDVNNSPSHVVFVRDVAPNQRSQYQPNIYDQNTTDEYLKKKNYTVRIQGVKTDSDNKYASILPEIKLPSFFFRQYRFKLVVAAVIEERNEKQVTWRLSNFQKFLRDDVETDTVHYNPLRLNIDRLVLSKEGIFKLPLRMCTIPRNQSVATGSAFYRLPLSVAQKLHSADHIPNTARLACVMADQNDNIQWETFGLSDFMRPKSYAKRKVESLDFATTNINEFTEKQLKIPHIAESISMIPKRTTASNLSKNHNFLIKNFTTAWLGSNLTKKYDSISELYRTVNPVAVFENPDSLIQYLAQRHNRKIVLILSDYLNESNISSIHNLPQLHSIYIFCSHSDKNEEWTKQWRKVIGIFHDITSIFHELKQITREHIHDFIPSSMTSISSNTDLNACTSSFMYSQIFKEILLQMQCNEKIKQDVIDCVHTKLTDNDATLRAVDQFNQDYNSSSPIWWYTKESFLYSLLNKALRAKDNDAIVKMRYFTRDLHTRFNRFQFLPNSNGNSRFDSIIIDETEGLLGRFCKKTKRHLTIPNKLTVEVVSIYDFYQQIERLHLKKHQTVHATLYRGQAMSTWEFEKLKQRKDGLMSFNNFLSTSIDRDVSLCYAESAQSDPDLIGILFTIAMNISVPSSSFTPWNISYHGVSEEEMLFSMNSVFRIEEIECVDDRLWEVNLTLFDNHYKKRGCQFNQHKQKMTSESATLRNLCLSMIDMGEFEKAEEIYKKLPETEFLNNLEELAYLYKQLGYIKNVKNDFNNALSYYQKALQILNDNLSDNHAELARLFNNIGMVHRWIGDSATGISYLRQALDIQQKSTTLTYPDAIMIYNNIGQLYSSRAAYITSLSYFQKAIEIQQNFHVSSYPFLALTYANLGQVYYLMEDRSTALNFLQKTLEIQEQSSRFIPADRAETYNMIGSVHESMKYYTAALESFQKALRIQEAYLPCMHQDIAKTCDNIGRLYNTTGNNLAESSHFQETHKIRQKLLSYSHPYVAKTCCNVGEPYRSKKSCRHVPLNCSKSFKHQFVYLASHRFKPVTTDTVTYVMEKPIRNRSEMTCYLETALNTHRATCRFNKSGLMITSESNVGFHPSENNLNLSHYDESTIKLSTNNLASNNLLARTFNNTVASVSEDTNKYPNSFSFFEKVLEIYRKSLTPNHPDSTDPYDNTGSVYSNTGEYSKALSYYKKALEIRQKTLTANHPDLATSYSNIGSVYSNTGEYSKALSYYEKALEIRQKTPSASHLDLAAFYSNIGSVYSNMGEYSKALSYYEKALEIRQDSRFLNRFRHTQVRNDIDCTTNETYKT